MEKEREQVKVKNIIESNWRFFWNSGPNDNDRNSNKISFSFPHLWMISRIRAHTHTHTQKTHMRHIACLWNFFLCPFIKAPTPFTNNCCLNTRRKKEKKQPNRAHLASISKKSATWDVILHNDSNWLKTQPASQLAGQLVCPLQLSKINQHRSKNEQLGIVMLTRTKSNTNILCSKNSSLYRITAAYCTHSLEQEQIRIVVWHNNPVFISFLAVVFVRRKLVHNTTYILCIASNSNDEILNVHRSFIRCCCMHAMQCTYSLYIDFSFTSSMPR